MKTLTTLAIVAGLAAALPLAAAADTPRERLQRLDRIEDRIDRRENYIDRQTDNGPLDRIEDRIDRREDIADRLGFPGSRVVDRHERRSWWRLRHGNGRD